MEIFFTFYSLSPIFEGIKIGEPFLVEICGTDQEGFIF